MNADAIRVERPATTSRLFAHTRWDAVPAAAGLFHLAYFLGLFFLYPHAPLWVMLILGFIYLANGQCEHQRGRAQFHS
jgi:hypothetical protein